MKLPDMDDTDRDTLDCGVAGGRERGDDFDLFSLGRLPAHLCISKRFVGKMLSSPECERLALGESSS